MQSKKIIVTDKHTSDDEKIEEFIKRPGILVTAEYLISGVLPVTSIVETFKVMWNKQKYKLDNIVKNKDWHRLFTLLNSAIAIDIFQLVTVDGKTVPLADYVMEQLPTLFPGICQNYQLKFSLDMDWDDYGIYRLKYIELLNTAIINDNIELIEVWCKNSIDVGFWSCELNPLCTAIERNKPEIVDILCKNKIGIDGSWKEALNWPLDCAIINNNANVVRILCEYGIKKTQRGDPLLIALSRHRLRSFHDDRPLTDLTDVIRILLEQGANPNCVNFRGTTALGFAARVDDEYIVQLLLDHGANPLASKFNFIAVTPEQGWSNLYIEVDSDLWHIERLRREGFTRRNMKPRLHAFPVMFRMLDRIDDKRFETWESFSETVRLKIYGDFSSNHTYLSVCFAIYVYKNGLDFENPQGFLDKAIEENFRRFLNVDSGDDIISLLTSNKGYTKFYQAQKEYYHTYKKKKSARKVINIPLPEQQQKNEIILSDDKFSVHTSNDEEQSKFTVVNEVKKEKTEHQDKPFKNDAMFLGKEYLFSNGIDQKKEVNLKSKLLPGRFLDDDRDSYHPIGEQDEQGSVSFFTKMGQVMLGGFSGIAIGIGVGVVLGLSTGGVSLLFTVIASAFIGAVTGGMYSAFNEDSSLSAATKVAKATKVEPFENMESEQLLSKESSYAHISKFSLRTESYKTMSLNELLAEMEVFTDKYVINKDNTSQESLNTVIQNMSDLVGYTLQAYLNEKNSDKEARSQSNEINNALYDANGDVTDVIKQLINTYTKPDDMSNVPATLRSYRSLSCGYVEYIATFMANFYEKVLIEKLPIPAPIEIRLDAIIPVVYEAPAIKFSDTQISNEAMADCNRKHDEHNPDALTF